MKKKIILASLLIGSSLLGTFSLLAANNRIEIVDDYYAAKQLSTDGMHITNSINKSQTDLVNGEVAIDIVIDNSKKTEIFYVLDNSSDSASTKANVIDAFKNNAKELENFNVNQGIVTTTDGNTSFIELDDKNIESQLESVKEIESSKTNTNEIFKSIEKAASSFSENAEVKTLVISINNMASLTTTEINELKTKINGYNDSGIKIIVYGINLSNNANFRNIFNSAAKYEVNTSNIKDIDFTGIIVNLLPQEKPAIATTVSFDKYILDNFTIKDIKTNIGTAKYDENSKQVIWEAGNIKTNQVAKLSYYLSLNSEVDQDIIERLELKTNRQIKVTQSGQLIGWYPADDVIEDQICSPRIKILREAVDNPKTGITNYIIFGSCMLAVALITILVLNKKNQFSRI